MYKEYHEQRIMYKIRKQVNGIQQLNLNNSLDGGLKEKKAH